MASTVRRRDLCCVVSRLGTSPDAFDQRRRLGGGLCFEVALEPALEGRIRLERTRAIADAVEQLEQFANDPLVGLGKFDGATGGCYGRRVIAVAFQSPCHRASGASRNGFQEVTFAIQPILKAGTLLGVEPFEQVATVQPQRAVEVVLLHCVPEDCGVAPETIGVDADFIDAPAQDDRIGVAAEFTPEEPNRLIQRDSCAPLIEFRPEECEQGVPPAVAGRSHDQRYEQRETLGLSDDGPEFATAVIGQLNGP
jgi:hypothetical protein